MPTAWSIAATGDYDGDGKSDLLWRDTSGNAAIWFMNGASVASSAGLGNIPPSGRFKASTLTEAARESSWSLIPATIFDLQMRMDAADRANAPLGRLIA